MKSVDLLNIITFKINVDDRKALEYKIKTIG